MSVRPWRIRMRGIDGPDLWWTGASWVKEPERALVFIGRGALPVSIVFAGARAWLRNDGTYWVRSGAREALAEAVRR